MEKSLHFIIIAVEEGLDRDLDIQIDKFLQISCTPEAIGGSPKLFLELVLDERWIKVTPEAFQPNSRQIT